MDVVDPIQQSRKPGSSPRQALLQSIDESRMRWRVSCPGLEIELPFRSKEVAERIDRLPCILYVHNALEQLLAQYIPPAREQELLDVAREVQLENGCTVVMRLNQWSQVSLRPPMPVTYESLGFLVFINVLENLPMLIFCAY